MPGGQVRGDRSPRYEYPSPQPLSRWERGFKAIALPLMRELPRWEGTPLHWGDDPFRSQEGGDTSFQRSDQHTWRDEQGLVAAFQKSIATGQNLVRTKHNLVATIYNLVSSAQNLFVTRLNLVATKENQGAIEPCSVR
jgi:hypothetical protein